MNKSKGKVVRYNKWGYIFLIPFIVVYVVFQLIPLISTIYNSFFENYMSGLNQIGPTFVGLELQSIISGRRYLDLFKKYDDSLDHVFYSTDLFISFVRSLVFRCTSETERFTVF